MGSAQALCNFSVRYTTLLHGAAHTSMHMYKAQYAIYSYIYCFCSIQYIFCGLQHNHFLVYGLDYCAYYLQLAAAAALWPVATLCYLVTFYTYRAAVEQVLLFIDGMACCTLHIGASKKDRPRYNFYLVAVLIVQQLNPKYKNI